MVGKVYDAVNVGFTFLEIFMAFTIKTKNCSECQPVQQS